MREGKIPGNYNHINSKIINIVEIVIMDAIAIFIASKMKFGETGNITFGLCLAMVATMFGLYGMDDQSLWTGIINYIKFKKKRRVLNKPTAEYIKARDKAILKKKKKEMKNR